MDIWLFWERTLLFVVWCKISLADDEIFKPNANNPKELNRFLNNVLQHKDDFGFVRDVARYYQKVKKSVNRPERQLEFHYLPSEQDILNEVITSMLQNREKRHLHYNHKNRIKVQNSPPLKFSNTRRSSRGLSKDNAKNFESKQKSINENSLDFESSVHKTFIKSKFKPTISNIEETPDYAVVNLADLQQKANDKRSLNNNKDGDYNNPEGNNLYSVDFGDNDVIDTYDDPMQPNQKFIEFNRHHTQNRPYHKYNNNHDNTYDHRIELNKFIDDKTSDEYVPDTDIEDFYNSNQRIKRTNQNDQNIKFHSRQLKFLDDSMIDSYSDNDDDGDVDDYNYERSRRNFLDKLDMKDEENYSEDNPYLDELKENNTNIVDDKRIRQNNKKINKALINDNNNNNNHMRNSNFQQPSGIFDKIKQIFHKNPEKPTNTTNNKTNKRKTEFNDFDDSVNNYNFQQPDANEPFDVIDKIKQIFHKNPEKPTNSSKTNKRDLEFNDFDDSFNTFQQPNSHFDDDRPFDVIDKIKKIFHKGSEKPTNSSKTSKREESEFNDFVDSVNAYNVQQPEANEPFDVIDKIKQIFHKNPEKSANTTKTNKREWNVNDFDDIVENNNDEGSEMRISRNLQDQMEINKNHDILEHLIDQLKYHKTDKRKNNGIRADLLHPNSTTVTQERNNEFNDTEDEPLTKLIDGQLPSKIVASIFNDLSQMNDKKKKLFSGLSRKHSNYTQSANMTAVDVIKDSSSPIETEKLLKRLAESLNTFITKEIHHGNCRRLSNELHEYLKDLTQFQSDDDRLTSIYVPNSHQDASFLFTQNQQNHHRNNEIDKKALEETLIILEKLLENYYKLNNNCQNRAKTVKEYIEKHIKILKGLIKNVDVGNDALTSKMDDDVGKLKYDMKRETKGKSYKSEQYKKLQRAVQQIREKRANEKKIGELFGKEMKRSPKFDINYEQPVVFNIA